MVSSKKRLVRMASMILLAGTALLALLVVSSPVSDADSQTGNAVNLQVTITLDTNFPGLLVGYDSNPLAPAPVSFDADIGSVHMIFTKSPQPNSPIDTRYRFNRWAGGPTTWGWNVTIVSNNTYTANFITQYLIQIRANIENPGPTVGSDIPGCDVQMPAPLRCWADASSSPSLIMLTPQTSAGSRYVFLQWSDGDLRQIRPIGPITGPATYVSMWSAEYYLTMALDTNTCLGSVTPTSGWHVKGDPVNIDWVAPTGVPAGEQYRFWRWVGTGLGNYTGGSQSASVTMNDVITETAYCHHEFQTTLDTSPIPLDYTIDSLVQANGLRTFWWEYMSVHWFNVTQTTQGTTTTQYAFLDWSGNPNPNHAAYTVLSSNSFMANFQTQYKITLGQIPASPSGLGGLACSNADCWYNEGAAAMVTVTSPWPGATDTRYLFSQWSGDASGTSTSFTFATMNAPKTATANWNTQYKITVNTAHGSATCSNPDCWYQAGTQATISLGSPADVTADARYIFTSWSGDASGTSRPLVITMDSPKNVIANWTAQYMLAIDSTCGTTSDCGYPIGSGWHDAGFIAVISITTPFTDSISNTWDFTGWSGDASGTTPSTDVLMDAPKNVTASWSMRGSSYRLTVITPYGAATCSPNADCMFSPDSMATVTLSTLNVGGGAGTRHIFSIWTGDATNDTHPLVLRMDRSKTVTAVWKTQHLLTIVSRCDSEDDCGSPVGAGWYDNGSSAVVSVYATHTDISGNVWEFHNWTGGANSDANSAVVIMDGPKTAVVIWNERILPDTVGIDVWVWLVLVVSIIVVVLVLVMWAVKRKRAKGEELGK